MGGFLNFDLVRALELSKDDHSRKFERDSLARAARPLQPPDVDMDRHQAHACAHKKYVERVPTALIAELQRVRGRERSFVTRGKRRAGAARASSRAARRLVVVTLHTTFVSTFRESSCRARVTKCASDGAS